MAVEPKFSHSTDHYIRLYAKITRSATGANKNLNDIGYIRHCFHCLNRVTKKEREKQSECTRCGHPTLLAGPLFLGSLSDSDFCNRLIQLHDFEKKKTTRLSRLLQLELEEVDAPPTYYTIDALCDRIGIATPSPIAVLDDLRKQGYLATRTHFDGRAFKTNAPIEIIEALIRQRS